jgi:preprotein translocase subunit SecG
MEIVVLSIHLLVSICLIGLVLLQRSEGGALGVGGGSSSLMSGRGAADALARMTSVAGGFFLVTSLGLTVLSGAHASSTERSVLDRAPQSAPATPAAPEPTRSDPTESSVPAETQVVSLAPTEAAAIAPEPSQAIQTAARAAPLEVAPAQPRAQPAAVRTASTTPVTRPAATRTSPQTQRSGTAISSAAPQQTPVTTNNGAVSGITLTDTAPESSENALEAVRRERAGPDQ